MQEMTDVIQFKSFLSHTHRLTVRGHVQKHKVTNSKLLMFPAAAEAGQLF